MLTLTQAACAEAGIAIRWMIRRDMPEVLDIEQQSFEFAWTEEDFLCCLRQRNCIGMVAERGTQIVGHMVYELHKERIYVLRFAVDNRCQRQGVGTAMAVKLIEKLDSQRRHKIVLDVPDDLLPMHCFLRSMEFIGGVSRDVDDAYRFEFWL